MKPEGHMIVCQFLAESDKAVKILDEETGEIVWFPLSQVDELHFDTKTDRGYIVVTKWIAKQKGYL